MTRGVCYVAYGHSARKEARESIASLLAHSDLPVKVIGDEWPVAVAWVDHESYPQRDLGGRWAKLNLDRLSPWGQTLYLDADTRVHGDVSAGFEVLDDGWDMAMAFSARQGSDVLGNCPEGDREAAFEAIGTMAVLGLQAGTFFVAWNDRTRALWAAWREEWERWEPELGCFTMDQAAFVRALGRCPVRLWILGLPWNSQNGEIVEHRFGAARRAA
jgi:hypothetical protein